VANASEVDPSTLVKPVWGVQWQVSRYYEVLIGPKIDPFCFSVIPSNSSEGKLCYRADYGAQYADATFNGGEGALRIDLNSKSIVGNVSSTVLHEGPNFWIVNTFPWYTLGTQQCVCTEVYQGGDKSTTAMYPVQYNWTEQLVFIAREEVGVEYTGTTQVTRKKLASKMTKLKPSLPAPQDTTVSFRFTEHFHAPHHSIVLDFPPAYSQ